jgi:hypothetical protein
MTVGADYPFTFSFSRSCESEQPYSGMEVISRTILRKGAINPSDCHLHGGVCLKDVQGYKNKSVRCFLSDTCSGKVSRCYSSLTAHDAASIGVDIPSHRPTDSFELVTWNLASPNNNPFEFWVRSRNKCLTCFVPTVHSLCLMLDR